MTSTAEVKQEGDTSPLQLHLATPGSLEWCSAFKISTPQLPTLQPLFPSCSEVPLAKANRGSYRPDLPSALLPIPPASSLSLLLPDDARAPHFAHSDPLPQPDDPPSRPHVSRPPNAFMLFRSDFLKRGVIPNNVERRQQNLSRIAGQVWNMLDPEEKACWHEQAARVLAEHQRKHPDYKFTPAPRGSRRLKSKAREDNPLMGDEEIRRIRETYARVIGPSPASSRKRRHHKKARSVEVGDRFPVPVKVFPPSATAAAHPFYSPSHPLADRSPFVQPLPFLQIGSFPMAIVPRRPSTSLGFTESKNDAMSAGGQYDGHSPPASPNPGTGFLSFISNRFRNLIGGQPSNAVAHTSPVEAPAPPVYPPWRGFASLLVAPQLSIPGGPIHPQLAGPSAPSPAAHNLFIPSPSDETNLTAGFVETPVAEQPQAANSHNPFGSIGIHDDMLSYLKAPYDTSSHLVSEDAKEEFWLPDAESLEHWDFHGDLANNLSGLFTMGEYKDTTA